MSSLESFWEALEINVLVSEPAKYKQTFFQETLKSSDELQIKHNCWLQGLSV